MIRINLLPEEYRRAERMSPKVFGGILAAVVLVCSSFGWLGYVYFGELGTLEVKHARTSEDKSKKEKRAQYFDATVVVDGDQDHAIGAVDVFRSIGEKYSHCSLPT